MTYAKPADLEHLRLPRLGPHSTPEDVNAWLEVIGRQADDYVRRKTVELIIEHAERELVQRAHAAYAADCGAEVWP